MKRIISIVLALIMLLPACALAATETVSFGDFTLDIDSRMLGEYVAGLFDPSFVKTENEILFTLYPNYAANDYSTNLNATWVAYTEDFGSWTQEQLDAWVQEFVDALGPAYEQGGMPINTYEVYESSVITLDGYGGMLASFSLNIDMSSMGIGNLDLFQELVYISDPDIGTYCFSLTSTDKETVYDVVEPILMSLKWTHGQTAASAGGLSTSTDFGDFSLTIDPDMPVTVADGYPQVKAEETALVTLYPAWNYYDDMTSNLVVSWTSSVDDFTMHSYSAVLRDTYANTLLDAMKAGYAESALDLVNAELLGAEVYDLDGVLVFDISYVLSLDLKNLGADMIMDLYQRQIIAGADDMGTYIFTLTTSDETVMSDYLSPVIDTLTWN